jgi:hypothetical protein
MKVNKLIIYQIVVLLTMINTFYLYFGGGLGAFSVSKAFFMSTYQGGLMLFVLWILGLLVTLSYIVQRVIVRKNLLRISLIIVGLLLLSSIIKRIMEFISGVFCVSCIISTILYLILFIMTISILKELYLLIEKLFD